MMMITIMIISTMIIPPKMPIAAVLLLLLLSLSASVELAEVLGELEAVETERVLETGEGVFEDIEVLKVFKATEMLGVFEDVKVIELAVIEA